MGSDSPNSVTCVGYKIHENQDDGSILHHNNYRKRRMATKGMQGGLVSDRRGNTLTVRWTDCVFLLDKLDIVTKGIQTLTESIFNIANYDVPQD